MPNKKITQLDQITSVTGTEQVPVQQTGIIKRTTTSAFTGRLKELAREANSTAIQDARETGRATIIDGLSAGAVTQQDLSAVSAGLHRSPNPVTAMFVYDTSKDSDGGAWTTRCQGTSWYNEPLCGRWLGAVASESAARAISGATTGDYFQLTTNGRFYKLNATSGTTEVFRGNKAEFPALVGIVAEASSVTLYDLTETGRPMWMRFIAASGSGQSYLPSTATSTVFVLNGVMVFGGGIYSGIVLTNFVRDRGDWYYSSNTTNTGKKSNNISGRNSPSVGDASGFVLPQHNINAVAMTVLPDAPVDPVTNLKIPSIAVATSGGISLIKNGSTVYSTTPQTTSFNRVQFTDRGLIASRTADSIFYYYPNPANITANFTLLTENTGLDFNQGTTKTVVAKSRSEIARAAANRIQLLKHNETSVGRGATATITSAYNTGYMAGDIRRSYMTSTLPGIQTSVSGAVRSLFLKGEQGVWYDPSDTSTLFQDAAGTIPVTAVEQPVGLMLDKSLGLALGPELVVNGGFDADTSWTKGANWSIAAGVATHATGTAGSLSQVISIVSGKRYLVSVTVSNMSGSGGIGVSYAAGGTTLGTITANGTYTFRVSAVTGDNSIFFYTGAAQAATIDAVSVRELPGNHAYQTTNTNRPVLSARVNLLQYTEQFDNAYWTKAATTVHTTKVTDPFGGTKAQQIFETDVSSNHSVNNSLSTAVVPAGAQLKNTIYVKPNGRTRFVLSCVKYGGVYDGFNVFINLSDKSYTSTINGTGTFTSCVITGPDAYGFYRIETIGSVGAYTNPFSFVGIQNDSGADTYLGDVSKGLIIYGADLRVANDGIGLPPYQRVGAATYGTSDTAGVPDYDTEGFPKYLRFDGSNDFLQTNSINFTATNEMTVFAGVRKLSDVNNGIIVEAAGWAKNGAFSVVASALYGTRDVYEVGLQGTTLVARGDRGFVAPISNVLTASLNIGASTKEAEIVTRYNGNTSTQTNWYLTGAGTENFASSVYYIGMRAGTTFPFNGRIYSLIVRGAATPDSQLAAVERYIDDQMTRSINNTLQITTTETLTQPNGDPIYVSIINKE